ncbi:MAG: hypothetical protein RLZZ273_478 [Bacteroidota bacterium]
MLITLTTFHKAVRKSFTIFAIAALLLSACESTDIPVDPEPTPDVVEKDSVVISQERYDKALYSDTVNFSIVKENGLGAAKAAVHDFNTSNHKIAVAFSSESFTKGEVKVILYGRRPTMFDPEPQIVSYMFSSTKKSVVDTLTGIVSSVAVVSGPGTTCRMKGQLILLP